MLMLMLMLMNCNSYLFCLFCLGLGKPSLWLSKSIRNLIKALGLNSKHKYINEMSSETLLTITRKQLQHDYNIINSSFILTRFEIYQQLLIYIDEWWERGIRPHDILKGGTKESSYILGKSSIKDSSIKDSTIKDSLNVNNYKNKNKIERNSKKQKYLNWGEEIRTPSIDHILKDDDESGRNNNNNNNNSNYNNGKYKHINEYGGWICVEPVVEIASFQQLLESITPLNRAFGWGIDMKAIVKLTSIICNLTGYLFVKDKDFVVATVATVSDNNRQSKNSNISCDSRHITHINTSSSNDARIRDGTTPTTVWNEQNAITASASTTTTSTNVVGVMKRESSTTTTTTTTTTTAAIGTIGTGAAISSSGQWIYLKHCSKNITQELNQCLLHHPELQSIFILQHNSPSSNDFIVYIPNSSLRVMKLPHRISTGRGDHHHHVLLDHQDISDFKVGSYVLVSGDDDNDDNNNYNDDDADVDNDNYDDDDDDDDNDSYDNGDNDDDVNYYVNDGDVMMVMMMMIIIIIIMMEMMMMIIL